MVIDRFYSTRNKKIDQRRRVGEVAENIGARQWLFLE
jgi:hypothetical protein